MTELANLAQQLLEQLQETPMTQPLTTTQENLRRELNRRKAKQNRDTANRKHQYSPRNRKPAHQP